jgi:hypothetical protein
MADEKTQEQPAPEQAQRATTGPPQSHPPEGPPAPAPGDERLTPAQLEQRQRAISETRRRVGPPREDVGAPAPGPGAAPDVPPTDCAPPNRD